MDALTLCAMQPKSGAVNGATVSNLEEGNSEQEEEEDEAEEDDEEEDLELSSFHLKSSYDLLHLHHHHSAKTSKVKGGIPIDGKVPKDENEHHIRLDVTVAIEDIDDVDCVGGDWSCKFRVLAAYEIKPSLLKALQADPKLSQLWNEKDMDTLDVTVRKNENSIAKEKKVKVHHLSAQEKEHLKDNYVHSYPEITVTNFKLNADDMDEHRERETKLSLYEDLTEGAKVKYVMMWDREFHIMLKEVFELSHFPFDSQDLSIDLQIDREKFDDYDLHVENLRFFKNALENFEWDVLNPNVMKMHRFLSEVHLRVRRRPAYYIQNVVFIMALLSGLGLISFMMHVDDYNARIQNLFTLILTMVAFKFVIGSALPKVSYNTLLDYFVNGCMIYLSSMCVAVLIPNQLEDPDTINLYMMYAYIAAFGFFVILWFIICAVAVHMYHVKEKEEHQNDGLDVFSVIEHDQEESADVHHDVHIVYNRVDTVTKKGGREIKSHHYYGHSVPSNERAVHHADGDHDYVFTAANARGAVKMHL